jgi:D-alanyl-D-alanine carboxypeptidase/D-alanyl-D-alanine-endopeptidase (penicillin-binding protein 4)
MILCAILPVASPAAAQNSSTLLQRVTQITARPVFKHSTLGVEVYDLTANKTLVAINQDKLFTSGSTTKLVTEGAALALLGENYRFHTRVYSTGEITPDGTLQGDLVLVASGDPNLSGRVEEDDTLAFTPSDHAYAGVLPGKSVIGDPLQVFKELAIALIRKGIWRIHGNVTVDASLFPSDQVEPGTRATISPIVLNDNVIDVKATSAASTGGRVSIEVAPQLPYLKVINRVRTGNPESNPELRFTSDIAEADGSHTVVLEGSVPAGRQRAQAAYKVKDPVLFATQAFREALRWAHIGLEDPSAASDPASVASADPKAPAGPIAKADPRERKMLAEHVSPPLKEEVKLTLKVSQNLHAATTPYLLGAILAHNSPDAFRKGIGLERRFLADAGLNPESVSQLDGEGGIGSAFSPDFMVRYLAYMSRQPYGRQFFDSLPVLGRDGTLSQMLQDSPAAGHVHAKTGSYVVANALDSGVMVMGKGLVGYVDAANGHRLIFAAYVNLVPLRSMEDVAGVGETLAEIAALIYQYAPPAAIPPARKAPTRAPRHH